MRPVDGSRCVFFSGRCEQTLFRAGKIHPFHVFHFLYAYAEFLDLFAAEGHKIHTMDTLVRRKVFHRMRPVHQAAADLLF